jgi:hypothetical protein
LFLKIQLNFEIVFFLFFLLLFVKITLALELMKKKEGEPNRATHYIYTTGCVGNSVVVVVSFCFCFIN